MSESHKGISLPYKRRKTIDIDGHLLYKCGRCSRFLCCLEFHPDKRMLDGLKSQCKKCHSECAIRTRNKDKANASKRISEAKRRAIKANSIITNIQYNKLTELLGDKCLCCLSPDNIQWDHIIPLSKGGQHSMNNLQPLCKKCNEIKQSRTADYRSNEQKVWVIEFEKVENP